MYIGIDVGGTNIKAGIVDDNGNILAKGSVPTGAGRGENEIIADMALAAKKVLESAGVDVAKIKSIGIGIPGSCDNETGVVGVACNINFKNVPIREEFQKHINKPVFIGNDADCAAVGEYFSMDKKPDSMVMVTLGTGIGGGILFGGKIHSGFNFTAGEIGHTMYQKGGRKCSCGRCGCWETYGSVTGLIASVKEAISQNPDSLLKKMAEKDGVTGRLAFDAAALGDTVARDVLDRWIEAVADGVVDIINILQPDMVCIGGAVSQQKDVILPALCEYVKENRYKGSERITEIVMAKLGNDAGLIGAAFLGKNI